LSDIAVEKCEKARENNDEEREAHAIGKVTLQACFLSSILL
jgi:hypothetical protein